MSAPTSRSRTPSAREIIAAGLADLEFIERATTGFDVYRDSVEPWTLEEAERVTGVPAEAIRDLAHAYGRAEHAQLCWTLGITEHHNAVDNVFALINLALLTGQVGRWGSGLQPLRGQNNVQGGGDMGAIPNKLPGFQDLRDDGRAASSSDAGTPPFPPQPGWHLTGDVRGDGAGRAACALRAGREPGAVRSRPRARPASARRPRPPRRAGHLPDQDGRARDVVLPAAAALGEADGTVTSSERRVQRVRQASNPPGGARDDVTIFPTLRAAWPRPGHRRRPRRSGTSCARSRRCTPGMSYARLEGAGGIQWPC